MEYDCTTAFGTSMDFDDDELHTILLEQSLELPAAMTFESDHDLAFQLQMQEALKASAALHHHSSSSSPPPITPPQSFKPPDDLAIGIASLLAEDIARYERERSDRKHAEAETVRTRDDLARRIHDQAFARDLSLVPDPQWAHTGDHFSRPYGQGSSSSSSSSSAAVPNAEPLRLYFKGLLREETVIGGGGEWKTTSAGVGIAICDMRDERVLEMRKPLVCSGDILSPEVVELKALILGLETAVSLGIKRLTVFCSDSSLHQYVSVS